MKFKFSFTNNEKSGWNLVEIIRTIIFSGPLEDNNIPLP